MTGHRVVCGDFAHGQDPDEEWAVEGFRTAEAAAEYARRFVRDQIEGMRDGYADAAALSEAFFAFGEYALAPGFELKSWVAHCIANPAARRAETDYQAIEPPA